MRRKLFGEVLIYINMQFFFIMLLRKGIVDKDIYVTFIYNVAVLWEAYRLLKKKFCINLFKNSSYILKAIFTGGLYAIFYSLIIILFFSLWAHVSLFPIVEHTFSKSTMCIFILLQIVVALSEEAFFRFFLYEFIKKETNSIMLAILFSSLLFSLMHMLANGIWKQCVLSFFLSLYIFAIKHKDNENSYIQLVCIHFFYNCFAYFVFSI